MEISLSSIKLSKINYFKLTVEMKPKQVWCLFLIVNLTTFEMNYNPEMEGTPVRGISFLVLSG